MLNLELSTSMLFWIYLFIVLFCVVIVLTSVLVVPDLYSYFTENNQNLGSVSNCNKYLDYRDIELYERCLKIENVK